MKAKALTKGQALVAHAFLFYFLLLLPVAISHEIGHAVVCSFEGGGFNVGISMRGLWMDCLAEVDDNVLFYAMGGIFGLLGSLAIVVTAKKLIHSVGLLVAGLAFAVDNGVKIFLEGFATEFYLTSTASDILVTIVQVGSLAGLLWFFVVKEARKQKIETT